MAQRGGIKWTNSQVQTLQRQVKRFNAKISRAAKKNPTSIPYLPTRLSVKELREKIKTASDLKLFSASVDRAFRPGAFDFIASPQGIITTQWQLREIELGVRRINAARKRERERAQPSKEKGTIMTIREANLQPKRFNFATMKPNDWAKFVESVVKQSTPSYESEKMEQYKQNYLKALLSVFNSDAADIYAMVERIPARTVVDAFYDNPRLALEFLYTRVEYERKLNTLRTEWSRYVNEGN